MPDSNVVLTAVITLNEVSLTVSEASFYVCFLTKFSEIGQ